jgi:hypothetical protein
MRSLFLLCCVLFVTTLSAQVSFSSLPFSQALQDAQAQGKLIFLQFEAANCEQCNDVANKGLKDKIVAERINQTFYCLKVDAHYPDRVKIAHDYNIDADKGSVRYSSIITVRLYISSCKQPRDRKTTLTKQRSLYRKPVKVWASVSSNESIKKETAATVSCRRYS